MWVRQRVHGALAFRSQQVPTGAVPRAPISISPKPGPRQPLWISAHSNNLLEADIVRQTPGVCQGANSTSSQTIGYEVVASGGFDSLGLMDGTLPNGYLSNGDVITTEEQFCLGASTFNCTTTSSNYGYLQVQETSNGSGGYTSVFAACLPGSGGCSISAATGSEIGIGRQTQIAIQDTVSISTLNSGGKPVFIDSFYNDFETAPEPSTFVLLGIALAGFGLLRLRQKRA